MKKVLFQVKASKLITVKCCRGIFKFWMKYYKDGGSGGRSSRSLKRCQISIRSNCPPAGITLTYSTTQIYTFHFKIMLWDPNPEDALCKVAALRKKVTSLSSRQCFQTACRLRSEMFESFKNCAANLHQLRPLPTKHPCQLQKSQTPKIQQSLPSLHANTMPWNYFDVGGFHKILQKSIGIVVSEILLSREFHRVS